MGRKRIPIPKSVETSGEDAYNQYSSKATFTKKNLRKNKKVHSNFKIDFSKEECIKIKEYTEGNRVKLIKIGNLELSGVEVRTLLSLRSANFKVTIEKITLYLK